MSDMVNYIGEVAILCTKISICVIVYDKYGHCIEMLLIRWNVAYKWCLQQYPYMTYTIAYRDSLYATFRCISIISMQCPYLSYTITYMLIFVHKIATSLYSLPYLTYFDHILHHFIC